MSRHGEYIRKGTKWDQIERNREEMMERCPNTDFYVSSTVSLYNADHITDFHRAWVDRGYLKAQDWNVNILQGPDRDRIDILPQRYKEQVTAKVQEHIDWLRPQDYLQRATSGYEGMLHFMNSKDNSHLLKEFFRVNDVHDAYRKECFEDVFTEYKDLRTYVA
jgi:hypothetical protein